MNNNIVTPNYLKNAFKNLFLLLLYWKIFHLIYSSTFANDKFTLNNALETIEFMSAITICLIIILIICKFIGSIIIGLLPALLILIIGCYYGDNLMTTYNISNNVINYFLLTIGIIFNIFLFYNIVINIKCYILNKKIKFIKKEMNSYETNDL